MSRLVIAWRVARAQVREIWRIASIRPMAPFRLLARVGLWTVRVALREFAFQATAAGVLVLIAMVLLDAAEGAVGLAVFALVGLATAYEAMLARESLQSASAVEPALEGLESDPGPRMRRSHLIFPLLMLVDRKVRVQRGLVFDPDRRPRLRLDVYRPALRPHGKRDPLPAVIQVHGGGWIVGSRLEQGIPLLTHLAATGWTGFNIDYRLSPQATWPDQIVDVKRAIAWVRENAEELGIDPERICITGGSAGGHLTALAGLTENDPAFQPGFEDADTSVSAAVPFYGIYDLADVDKVYYPELLEWVLQTIVFKARLEDERDRFRAASPRFRVHPGAPPFMVIHGEDDTLVPVADARTFVGALRELSSNPVRYIELPGSEHAFDLMPSLRTARTVEGIERFLRAVVEPRSGVPPARAAEQPLSRV